MLCIFGCQTIFFCNCDLIMMQWQCIVGYILDTVRLGLDIVTAMKFFIEVYRMAIVSESQIIIYRQYHMNELEKKKS